MGHRRRKLWILGVLVLSGGVSLAMAADPAADKELVGPPAPTQAVVEAVPFGPAATLLDDRAMSDRIDQLIAARWSKEAVTPAAQADDAEFFRRLSLHLNGRIPTITQLKDFLDDTHPDKRRIWARVLMGEDVILKRDDGEEEKRPGGDNVDLYVNHWATYWRHLFLSQSKMQQQIFFVGNQIEPWARNHVKSNTPYDEMVRQLMTGQQGNAFFQQALENKPEVIAGATARLFLGVKLECAQCHDDKSGGGWTRTQFWESAAFFTNRGGAGGASIMIPDKKQTVQARFLDGVSPQWRSGANSMTIWSEWLTSQNNPYFARATVNRMWHYMMGIGFTDPVDSASEENAPSHPELLDELSRQFVAHKFDIKWLVRAIAGTRAYQLTSARSHASQDNPRLFARFNVQGMSAEQLFDSIAEATGYLNNAPRVNGGFNPNGQPNTPRAEFIQKFTNPHEKRTETQTSILQALFLMNGKHTEDVLKNSKSLRTVQENVQGGTKRNLEELYIVTLSRKPRADELAWLTEYVESGGPTKDRKDALADVFWALINSGEFMLNH